MTPPPIPRARETEHALLALCLREPQAVTDAQSRNVGGGEFFGAVEGLTWSLLTKRADEATLLERLEEEHERMGAGSPFRDPAAIAQWCSHLRSLRPVPHHLPKYCEDLREMRTRRVLRDGALETLGMIAERTPAAEVMAAAQKRLLKATNTMGREAESFTARDLLREVDDEDEAKYGDFIPVGLKSIDNVVDDDGKPQIALRAGELVGILAPSGHGKTHTLFTLLGGIAKTGPALGFQGEMTKGQMRDRARSHSPPIDTDDLHWVRERNLRKIAAKIRMYHQRFGIVAVGIDYLQRLNGLPRCDTRAQSLREATIMLADLAKELGIVIILLLQVTDEVMKRMKAGGDGRPDKDDIAESKSVFDDLDKLIALYTPARGEPEGLPPGAENVVEWIWRKNRNGVGDGYTVLLRWDLGKSWIRDPTPMESHLADRLWMDARQKRLGSTKGRRR